MAPSVQQALEMVAAIDGSDLTPATRVLDATGHLAYDGAIDDNIPDPTAVRHRYLCTPSKR